MGKQPISNEIKSQIVEKRQLGFSVPEIHRALNISKSTVLRYVEGIEILPEFKQRWLDRRNASKIISEKAWEKAYKASEDLVDVVSAKELKLITAALYWAEGAKREFSFINSDAEMVKFFIQGLTKGYGIPLSSINVSLRIFEDIPKDQALWFWSQVTGIRLDSNTYIDVRAGSKSGKLPYGMCRIKVKKGGLLLKTIFAINKRVISLLPPRSSMD